MKLMLKASKRLTPSVLHGDRARAYMPCFPMLSATSSLKHLFPTFFTIFSFAVKIPPFLLFPALIHHTTFHQRKHSSRSTPHSHTCLDLDPPEKIEQVWLILSKCNPPSFSSLALFGLSPLYCTVDGSLSAGPSLGTQQQALVFPVIKTPSSTLHLPPARVPPPYTL